MSIPVENFAAVDGSMTSEDGQTFYYHVRREDGSGLMLGFPHKELPNIVECAAMQMDRGRNEDGGRMIAAFETTGFSIGRGPEGQMVLGMKMREAGTINFLLPPELQVEMAATLMRAETTKH